MPPKARLHFMHNDEKITSKILAKKAGILPQTARHRIIRVNKGTLSIDYALMHEMPKYEGPRKRASLFMMHKGKKLSVKDIANRAGINLVMANDRVHKVNNGAMLSSEALKKDGVMIEGVKYEKNRPVSLGKRPTKLDREMAYKTPKEELQVRLKARDNEYNLAMRKDMGSTRCSCY